MKKCLFWVLLVSGIAGCAPSLPRLKGMTYLSQPTLKVAVKSLRLIDRTSPQPLRSPQCLLSTPLPVLIGQWVTEHLTPIGPQGAVRLIIEKTGLEEGCSYASPPPSPEAMDIYRGIIVLRIEYQHPFLKQPSYSRLTVRAEKGIPPHCSVNDRRCILQSLCEELINRLNEETTAVLPHMIKKTNALVP